MVTCLNQNLIYLGPSIAYLTLVSVTRPLHNKPKAEIHPGYKLKYPKEEENLGLILSVRIQSQLVLTV
jgi:hypothetical protein